MEQKTLYDILEVEPTLETEEIKKVYQRLCLLYHPDKKRSRRVSSEDTKHFCDIQYAWEILRDPVTRKNYDETLRQSECMPLIHEEVDLDDMVYSAKDHVFLHPCRCGDCYYLTEAELEQTYDIVYCDTCSLAIRILYKIEED
jgi:diphthamide biosynthesis protein 4